MEQVANALVALFGNDDAIRTQADQFLQRFEKTEAAWQISKQLLTTTHEAWQFFGANTLLYKVRNEWFSLSRDATTELLQCLLDVIGKTSTFVAFRLCLLLAAIVIRQDASSIRDITKRLIELWATPSNPKDSREFLLQFLSELITELDTTVISYNKRQETKQAISDFTETVIALIRYILTSPQDNNQLKKSALKCLQTWILFGVPLQLLFSGTVPLFETLFASLSVSELFPSAIDVLLEILQKPTTFTNAKIAYQNRLAFEQNNDTQIMLSIIARITTIKETTFASAIKENNEHSLLYCQGLCKLALGIAEGHVALFAKAEPQVMPLIDLLLECTAHPDKNIAELSLDYWCFLEGNLQSIQQRQAFHSVYSRLLQVMVHQCAYGVHASTQMEDSDEQLLSFRASAVDTFESIYKILGQNFSAFIISMLQSNASLGTWRLFESALFAFSAVIRFVSEQEIVIYIVKCLLSFPSQPFVRTTGLTLLGNSGSFFANHIQLLESSVKYILDSFHAEKVLIHPAVVAFHNMCQHCPVLSSSLSTLIDMCTETIFEIENLEDKTLLIESLLYLVSRQPVEQIGPCLQRLNLNTMKKLQKLYILNDISNTSISSLITCKSREFEAHFTVFKSVGCWLPTPPPTSSSPLLTPVIMPALQTGLQKWYNKKEVVEPICDALVELLKLDKVHFGGWILPVANMLLECYTKYCCPYYLDVLQAAVELLASQSAFPEIVLKISNQTFQLMQQDIVNNVEILASYFDLLHHVLKLSPQCIFTTSLLPTVFQLAVVCLSLEERTASKSVISFLECLVLEIPSRPDCSSYVSTLLLQQGEQFITLSTSTQCRTLIQSDLLFQLVSANGQVVLPWIATALSSDMFATTKLLEKDKSNVFKVLSTIKDKRRFKAFIKDFNQVCTGQITADIFLSYELV